jgi:hypothetical protein
MSNVYLDENNIDDLGRMVVALLSEVWIMRDRMAVMEELLADKTGLTSADIDAYVPGPEAAARIERLRDRMVSSVVGAPLAARDRSVDGILQRAKMSRPQAAADPQPA